MLLGRASECGRIADLLDEARTGRGGVLVIGGEPGIGKSALLEYAARSAAGMRVLSARGVESEVELPFGALHELLGPVLDQLDRIPGPQAAALAGALALGPPVPGDRFAVAAGTLSLLGSAAADTPLVLVLDDAHWFDRSSAEALVFAARRLRAERVASLFAVRTGEAGAAGVEGLPLLVVGGLDPQSSRALLEVRAGDAAPSVADRIVRETEGNPLALTEIPVELTPGQLAGNEPLPELLPAGAGLAKAFRRRVEALPPTTVQALLFAAASDSFELDTVLRALAAAGIDAAALEPAERAALIETSGGRLAWRHPLVRSAVYHAATASQRRSVHRVSAAASEDLGRRAWHLAAAAEGLDDEVADLLERAAGEARDRRAHAAAADALLRAAELTSDDERRARRLFDASVALQAIGRFDRARPPLDQAALLTGDPLLQSGIQHLQGTIELWSGDRVKAHAVLLDVADRLESIDPARAAVVLVDTALAYQMDGDVKATLSTARRAEALVARSEAEGAFDAAPLLFNARVLAGEARAVRAELGDRLRRYVERDEAGEDLLIPIWVAHTLTWIDEYGDARRMFDREVARARANGSLGIIPFSLACLAEIDFRVGRWDTCAAGVSEAVRLAEDTAQHTLIAFCVVTLARLEAGRGSAESCRAHVRQCEELAMRFGVGSLRAYATSVSGLLELGLGNIDSAVSRLEQAAALVAQQGLREPGVIHWRPDLVEAYALAGRPEDARRALVALDEEVERTDRLWARAAAERCRGLLDDDFDASFGRALEVHDRLPMPFERARTQLRLGERLRRTKRSGDAREPLREALDVFESLGAAPWAAQARAELAATGERSRRRVESGLGGLTPQELRIAVLVAEGATNREAAAALFLSPKTVGYHLGKVYGKLGINSRAQLATLVARTTPAPTDLPQALGKRQ